MIYNTRVPNRRSRKPWVRTGSFDPTARIITRPAYWLNDAPCNAEAWAIAQEQMARACNGLSTLN